jgi:glyoxylase-like metal-dependent hydrolase (beta-lactamase superfamily II)
MALPPFVEPFDHGIYCIDTGFQRPRFDAAYLIVEQGRAAFVDTGTTFAVPRLIEALHALGLDEACVDAVIPTHVHLDHAGGVGALMQQLPHATVWVHERGARHMIDPTALYQGALEVYGQAEMDRSYGRIVGVDAARVRTTADGSTLSLSGRELLFFDTPGHARHHHCIWDKRTQGWFTGDTFGLSYREFDHPNHGAWVLPTTTPVQFEPEALRQSIQRLTQLQPRWMYVTHYGRVGDVQAKAEQCLALLDAMVSLGRTHLEAPDRSARLERELATLYRRSLAAHGFTDAASIDALLSIDVRLNAQGMAVWLDREATRGARPGVH